MITNILKNSKLLIIEDNIIYCNLLEKNLKEYGYENIYIFNNGTDALKNIHKINPDIILLDYHLPDTNGLTLLKQIKENFNKDIDIVLMSSNKDLDMVISTMKYGASDFLIKTENSINKIITSVMTINAIHYEKLKSKKIKKIKNITLISLTVLSIVISIIL